MIAVKGVMRTPVEAGANDVYLVIELMDTDLHQIVRSPQPLTDDHHQYFVYQILRGLKYVHSAGVLHRDLKVRPGPQSSARRAARRGPVPSAGAPPQRRAAAAAAPTLKASPPPPRSRPTCSSTPRATSRSATLGSRAPRPRAPTRT